MKSPFKLSKWNIIFMVIATIVLLFIKITLNGFSAYTLGYSIGTVAGLFVIALLVALFFWFVTGRKKGGGTIAFNIVVLLMLFGSFKEMGTILNARSSTMNNLKNAITDFKEVQKNNPDSINESYNNVSGKAHEFVDQVLANSGGDEKQVFLVIKDYLKQSDSINIIWGAAYDSVMAPRILDYSLLTDADEYNYQLTVLDRYINTSANYKDFVLNRIHYVQERTTNLSPNSKVLKGFMTELSKKDYIQQPVFKPYIDTHITYGNNLKGIVELLKRENDKWSYEDDILYFENDAAEEQFTVLIKKITDNEAVLNELSDKLVDTM